MNKPIGYWIKRLDAALEIQLDRTLARIKLTRRQWQTLATLIDDRLALSERGREKYHEAQQLVEDARQDLSMGIGIDEYAMALSVLERMSLNAERLAR